MSLTKRIINNSVYINTFYTLEPVTTMDVSYSIGVYEDESYHKHNMIRIQISTDMTINQMWQTIYEQIRIVENIPLRETEVVIKELTEVQCPGCRLRFECVDSRTEQLNNELIEELKSP